VHRSRLSTFVIDCKVDDLAAAAEFWSKALGRSVTQTDDDSNYRALVGTGGGPTLVVQKVEHDSRIHLDIECDDLDAEVARLEALGATRVRFVKRWWLMQAPTGQVFCIFNPRCGPLASKPNATQWPWPRALASPPCLFAVLQKTASRTTSASHTESSPVGRRTNQALWCVNPRSRMARQHVAPSSPDAARADGRVPTPKQRRRSLRSGMAAVDVRRPSFRPSLA
jgi:predicted enzyme related to lactoylglutathione lyase